MQMRITAGDRQFDAELYAHPVAEDFATLLPTEARRAREPARHPGTV